MTDDDNYVIGYYNAYRYQIDVFSKEQPNGETVYDAGNSPYDSQITVPKERGVGIEKMEKYCEQTAREIAHEKGIRFAGIDKLEDEEDYAVY